jgi:hypothetical protein
MAASLLKHRRCRPTAFSGAGALGIGSSPATADDQRDRLLSVAIVMYWQHGVREDLTSPVLT